MSTEARPWALVTGASSGIGLELSRLLAGGGHDLVVLARDAERLKQVAVELGGAFPARVVAMASDLSDPAAPASIARDLEQQGLRMDVLVNNAGFGLQGPFAELPLGAQLSMIQVNVTALTHLTGLLLPGMLQRGRGRVMNVASTAAFQSGPLMAVYYATKAYVLLFSEALSSEVRGSGVTVTAFCPGPTHTAFERRAGLEKTRLFQTGAMDAATVARSGYDGMMRGARVVVPGWINKLMAQAVRIAPRALATQIARSLHEPRAS
jgi:short-subunit dehydrogenase